VPFALEEGGLRWGERVVSGGFKGSIKLFASASVKALSRSTKLLAKQ